MSYREYKSPTDAGAHAVYGFLMQWLRLRLQMNTPGPEAGRRQPRWTATCAASDAVRQLMYFHRPTKVTPRAVLAGADELVGHASGTSRVAG